MVKKINHSQFGKIIKYLYSRKDGNERKVSLIVYGTFGVGKSAVVREKAKEIAAEKKKLFVEWNKITKEQKDEVFKNPEQFFILIDIRLSEFDSSDIKGLPDFKDNSSIEWKVPYWAKILENPDSDGILFFDEINLATPLVISSTYKIIYDRIVNESKINDNWLIIGAGNKDEDRAYTHELASPVRDRACEAELTPPSIDGWTQWAIDNEIDSRIIGFVNFKPSNLHLVNYDDGQKFTTERGWERLSTIIRGMKDYEELNLLSGVAIGEGIAREFVAFCKIQEAVNLKEIMNKPSLIKNITEASIRYFLVTAIAEQYKEENVTFEKMFEISRVLDEEKCAEFVALLWRLCIKYSRDKFIKEFKKLNDKKSDALKEKYFKYLVN